MCIVFNFIFNIILLNLNYKIMNLEQYLMPNILNEELKDYKEHIQEFFITNNYEFKYGQKRDNCGVVAAGFYMFMLQKGINVPRCKGDFVADIPLYEKLDFYKEELLQMKNLGLNPSLKDDRFEFMKIFNLENRQKRIPHYWNQDESGLIIDLSGYSQFVKKGFAKDLNQSRYEIKDLEKTNFKSLSLK